MNLSDASEASNIDAAYILQAYKFAKEWFLDRNRAFIELLDENFVVLLDNLKIVKEATANFDMSMQAVKNILSAA